MCKCMCVHIHIFAYVNEYLKICEKDVYVNGNSNANVFAHVYVDMCMYMSG